MIQHLPLTERIQGEKFGVLYYALEIGSFGGMKRRNVTDCWKNRSVAQKTVGSPRWATKAMGESAPVPEVGRCYFVQQPSSRALSL